MSSSPQFGTPVKSEEDVKTVTDELQKQYEKVLTGVKDFTKKSVKVPYNMHHLQCAVHDSSSYFLMSLLARM